MPPDEQSITSTPFGFTSFASATLWSGPQPASSCTERRRNSGFDGGPMRAHALHHLDREAHAVQFAAAVLVVAHVGERREELMDQVAVRPMDIEHVEARLVRAPRRLPPALDH